MRFDTAPEANLIWLSSLLCGLLLLALLPRAWGSLTQHRIKAMHLTLGASCGLMVLWSLSIDTGLGFHLHFLGLAAVLLVLGLDLAILSAIMASLAVTLVRGESWGGWPLSIILGSVVPIAVVHGLSCWERRRASRNFFVFILVNAFIGGMLSIVVSVCLALLLGWLLLDWRWTADHRLMLEYLPLIAMPEGILNGMILTGLLVFRPDWVRVLDESRYDTRSR